MIALIISDDDYVINNLQLLLTSLNYDTIKYRWLIKALDNIQEIQPDLVFISANEYPRHWKTLVQFLKSDLNSKKTHVFLYNSQEFNQEELKKINTLGIDGVLKDFNPSSLEKIKLKLQEYSSFIPSNFILTNPNNGYFMFGIAEQSSDSSYQLYFEKDFTDLNISNIVNVITLYDKNDSGIVFSGEISQINLENNSVIVKLKELYEKF